MHTSRNVLRAIVLAVVNFLIGGQVLAQELSIPLVTAPPVLADFVGMTPADDVRARYGYVSGFTQRAPQDGAPSSQRTDVYLGYDSSNFYAIFVAFDDDPASVRANLAPRENIENDDRVGLLIDTFDDQRTAYGFRSSPLGVQWDGRWSEVTRGGYDSSYEAVWYTDAQRTPGGYVVLMTIPFRTMRFPETGEQRWRVQFERLIPRSSEESYWPAYSQSMDGRLNQAAVLNGVRDVSPGRNIQLIPFAFVRSYDVLEADGPNGPGFTDDTEDDIGLDAKIVLKDSFVLDFTYNPDFSQVESDQPQVTVNERFEVQFPERRPFFLENADYFATETPLVFTRRIVDPEVGLKFTGRQGLWGVGTMLTNDEAPGMRVAPTDPLYGEAADIGVLRVFRDFGDQSRAGVLYTDTEFGNQYSRVSAADTYIKLTDNWFTELLMVNTDTGLADGTETTGRQTNWRVNRNGRHFNAHYHWTEQSKNFTVPLGILGRNYQPDTEGLHGFMEYRFWPEDTWIDRIGPRIFFVNQDDQSGLRVYSEFSPQLQMAWAGDSFFSAGINEIQRAPEAERLRRDLPTTRDYDAGALVRELLHGHVLEGRFRRELRRRHRHQSRSPRRRRAGDRRPPVAVHRVALAADRPCPRRCDVSVDVARRSERPRPDLRRHDFSHALEPSVYEGDVAAFDRPARRNGADRAVAPRARGKPEPRRVVPLRLEPLFGALRRLQQQREQSAARRYAAGPAARAYRGARSRRPTVVREVLVSLAAVIKRWRCSHA